MRSITISVNPDWKAQLRNSAARVKTGVESGEYQGEYLTYSSYADMARDFTEGRIQILRQMLHAGTVGVRELSRRLDRGVRRVHDDSQALVALGLLEKTEDGALECPFEHIHVHADFELTPAGVLQAA